MAASPRQQRLVLLVVCGVFISVGLALFIPACLLPLLDFLQMRKWRETPCTIIAGPFGDRPGPVAYAYEIDDVRYESENLGLEGMFLPMRSTFDLRPGATTVCYVNPRDRREAALWRDVDPGILLGFTPLIFVLLPGLALVLGWKNAGRPPPPEPPPVPAGPAPPTAVLASTRGARGCGILVVSGFLVFMGGILFVLWTFGGLLHLLISVPFALLWVLLLRQLGRMLLAMLNPRVALRVTPGRGTPGGAIDVRWDLEGGLRGGRRFTLTLEVREQISYRSGKSSTTRSSPLAALDVASGGPKELRRGSVRLTLPDTMHSFQDRGLAVLWAFRLKVEIPFGPDVDDEFTLEVGPACR